MTHKTLKNVNPKDNFVLMDGKQLKNIHELLETVLVMSDDQFKEHVNDEKHDMHAWVKDVHEDHKLARKLLRAKEKGQVANALNSRINEINSNDPSILNGGSHQLPQFAAIGVAVLLLVGFVGITSNASSITTAAVTDTGSSNPTLFLGFFGIVAIVGILGIALYGIRHHHLKKI
jgi:hypothetical protein